MELAGLSHERDVRLAAAPGPKSTCERSGRTPRAVALLPGAPMFALAVDPPAGDAALSDTADHLQADYFVRTLIQQRRLIDHRIEEYQKAIAISEADGDVDGAGVFRRMALSEESDRQTVDGLLDKLRRRFPLGDVAPLSRRAQSVVR